MELNQDIIPQIWLSIRPGLGERAGGREEGGGRREERDDKSEDRKLLSEAGGELNISLPFQCESTRVKTDTTPSFCVF